MTDHSLDRRTLLLAGLAAGITLPTAARAAVAGALVPCDERRQTALCFGGNLFVPTGASLCLCHVGARSGQALTALQERFNIDPGRRHSFVARLSATEVARHICRLPEARRPDIVVLLGDFRQHAEVEHLHRIVDGLKKRSKESHLFVVAALPPKEREGHQIEDLVAHCDGIIDL